MKKTETGFRLSATDLANHLACGHLTNLDVKASQGKIATPEWENPSLVVMQMRGLEHEKAYVAHLKSQGLTVVDLSDIESPTTAREKTIEAMRAGIDVVVQAALGGEKWFGKADILKKVPTPSGFGAWSYEAVDTKLSKETKSGAILQLCLYSECIGEIQAHVPEHMHVVSPGAEFTESAYRVFDYLAYYRFVKNRVLKTLEVTQHKDEIETYPDPVDHCEVCRWWKVCDQQRRKDDHLSIVAGVSKLQTRELEGHSIDTLEKLASHPMPFKEKFNRGTSEGFVRVREQARVQASSRKQSKPIFEMLPLEGGRGLHILPDPSKGDVFFDIEGDPFVGTSGLEYLFGITDLRTDGSSQYNCKWAVSADEERTMFEWFIDSLMNRWAQFPDFHIYHYAHYEPTAIKRLMGRYGTREIEVDRLLRAGRFIDLHAVAKQSIRASVESYSIKELEKFYGYKRQVPLIEASKQRRNLEHALELGRANDISADVKDVVQKYNEDDCESTLALRNWLEDLRSQQIKNGQTIPRPPPVAGDPSEAVSEQERIINELKARLTNGFPGVPEDRTNEQQAIWILAEMLAWHRREAKAPWWEFFRLRELSDEELLEERGGLSGLQFIGTNGGTARCPIHSYSFPGQESDIRSGESLFMRGGDQLGSVEAIDLENKIIEIKKRTGMASTHPSAVFEHNVVNTKTLSDALFRIGQWVAQNGITADGSFRAGRDLLLKLAPRLSEGTFQVRDNVPILDIARELATTLSDGVLAIQGPPGAGKTYTAAEMICSLLEDGKKVGITAVSHKVIRNLLQKVAESLAEKNIQARVIQKVSEESEENDSGVEEVTDNEDALSALGTGGVVVGGTAWLWTREEAANALDVLFVDEAGQMSLANVVAVSQAGGSLVLLGDPQQLDQPLQGSHPDGTATSALEHLLDGKKTIPADKGLFLAETWRLHPSICSFTSELFYESRLSSRPGLERQSLSGTGKYDGSGLWFLPVSHEGNQNNSPEEIEEIKKAVELLTRTGSMWTDKNGVAKQLLLENILVVAPYNAQVFKIVDAIPGVRAGTVDKFQGQEAPVVIYSMSTSSHEDAPRGMEFLYSLNRLNVATSRAKCCCILVGNPQLFEPNCRSPRQIQLVNAFCRYLEMAKAD